jgi:hypothetical protein
MLKPGFPRSYLEFGRSIHKEVVEYFLDVGCTLIFANSHLIVAGNQCGERTAGAWSKETQDPCAPFGYLPNFKTDAQAWRCYFSHQTVGVLQPRQVPIINCLIAV